MHEDKLAVITGAARGIGAAIAIKLAQRVSKIAIIDFCEPEATQETIAKANALDAECKFYRCDVSNFDAVKETISLINNDLGTIDILVNNAGITHDKLILGMKETDFDSVINVNLKGCFNTIHHAVSQMTKKRYGKIVNIASVAGIMGNPGQANYAASKAGVIGLTKTVAKELASRNICVNAVAPGFIDTDMTESFKSNETLINQIPQKRMGRPEEVADLVDFLASSAADYITGEVIRIDGGMAM